MKESIYVSSLDDARYFGKDKNKEAPNSIEKTAHLFSTGRGETPQKARENAFALLEKHILEGEYHCIEKRGSFAYKTGSFGYRATVEATLRKIKA